jgi:hypothetical protein
MASATVKLEKNRRPGSFHLDEAGIALLGRRKRLATAGEALIS